MSFSNKKQFLLPALAALAISGTACAQETPDTPTPQAPQGKVTIEQDKRIDKLVDAKKEMFRNNEATMYRIQIYNGTLKEANETLKTFRETFPEWKADISFELPNYKVRVGRFRTRLEADRKLMEVKKEYPNAFLLEPR